MWWNAIEQILNTLTVWFEESTSDFRTLRWTSNPMAMYHMRGWSLSTLLANMGKYLDMIFGLKTFQTTTVNTYKLRVHDHLLLEPCWWVSFGMLDAYKNWYAEGITPKMESLSFKGHNRSIKSYTTYLFPMFSIFIYVVPSFENPWVMIEDTIAKPCSRSCQTDLRASDVASPKWNDFPVILVTLLLVVGVATQDRY